MQQSLNFQVRKISETFTGLRHSSVTPLKLQLLLRECRGFRTACMSPHRYEDFANFASSAFILRAYRQRMYDPCGAHQSDTPQAGSSDSLPELMTIVRYKLQTTALYL